MKIYFISGLGADSHVFKNIVLPAGYEVVYLDWIPNKINESLSDYSYRLSQNITPGEPFMLVGLSMGGMIAAEITNQYKMRNENGPVMTILISSIATHLHLPFYFKIARFTRLHKLMPLRFLKSATMLNRFFSVTSKEDKAIFYQIVKDGDPVFIKWAMGAILHWKNKIVPEQLIHIHGSKDRILPLRFTKPTHIINKGKHFMVMERAGEINAILAATLGSLK